MTRRDWGSFHLVPNRWDAQANDADEFILETHRYGPSQLELAIELATLSGDNNRASRIKDIANRAYSRGSAVLNDVDIRELLESLDGLEARVRENLLGPDGLLPTERIPHLRASSTLLDLDSGRGELARYAVLEALSRIGALEGALEDARARGLHIFMD